MTATAPRRAAHRTRVRALSGHRHRHHSHPRVLEPAVGLDGGGERAAVQRQGGPAGHRREQHLEVDDLFPAAEALQMLRFAEIERGDIRLTEAGVQFAQRRPMSARSSSRAT